MAAPDQYGSYLSGGWRWGKSDYTGNGLLIRGRGITRTLAEITDGTASTVLVGEKALHPDLYVSGSWFYDQPFFLGNSSGIICKGTNVFRDTRTTVFIGNWGAAHSSGAQFVFADGSTRLIRYGTSPDVIQALLTPAGGDVAELP